MANTLRTVGDLMRELEAGKNARDLAPNPAITTLCDLSLAWFGSDLTTATLAQLRFDGAVRLGKYMDDEDEKGIDRVSLTDLAIRLRAAAKYAGRDHWQLPLSDIEEAGRIVFGKVSPGTDIPPQRFLIDLETNSATLDGVRYDSLDPVALRILKALRDAEGAFVSSIELTKLPRFKGDQRKLSRAITKLPDELRTLIKAIPGAGRRLELPPC